MVRAQCVLYCLNWVWILVLANTVQQQSNTGCTIFRRQEAITPLHHKTFDPVKIQRKNLTFSISKTRKLSHQLKKQASMMRLNSIFRSFSIGWFVFSQIYLDNYHFCLCLSQIANYKRTSGCMGPAKVANVNVACAASSEMMPSGGKILYLTSCGPPSCMRSILSPTDDYARFSWTIRYNGYTHMHCVHTHTPIW